MPHDRSVITVCYLVIIGNMGGGHFPDVHAIADCYNTYKVVTVDL